jgi:hypothetical protein
MLTTRQLRLLQHNRVLYESLIPPSRAVLSVDERPQELGGGYWATTELLGLIREASCG